MSLLFPFTLSFVLLSLTLDSSEIYASLNQKCIRIELGQGKK